MRVRRAQARLCGRDAHAPRGANLPPVSPSWERARVRVSRASSPRPAANERAIRVKRRAQPLRTGRLHLREHADASLIRPLRRVVAQGDAGADVAADVAGDGRVAPRRPAVLGYVRPRFAVRRVPPLLRLFAGGAGGAAAIRACLRLDADTKWRFGESPRRS